MFRPVRPRSTLKENIQRIKEIMPWRLFLLLPFLLVFAIPAFLLGTGAGHRLLPRLSNMFYVMANPTPMVDPTPMPAYPTLLPQPGGLLYTVQDADSCDGILINQMHMRDAGQIFTDTRPNTVQALNTALGQDCTRLQPGDQMTLFPQYPLVALGGQVLQVSSLSPAKPLPTPLIHIQQQQQQDGVDCTHGCLLTVRVAHNVQVKTSVETAIPVPVGAWIWMLATYPRKTIADFNTYPYADPAATLNGATLQACDIQINATHDANSLGCDQLTPNTIDDDGGAWLLAVTGPAGLDHWNDTLHVPPGTQVLLWLSLDNHGNLVYRHGNPQYRYDPAQRLYVPV